MKKPIHWIILLSIALSLQNCKPKTDPAPKSNNAQTNQTSDQSRVSDASDHGADEANNVISNESSLSGRTDATTALPCNVLVTTVAGDAFSRKLTFSGADCQGRFNRSGVALVKFVPATTSTTTGKWKDAGSKLLVTYQDLKVTRISDGEYVILNGSQSITNASGGNWINLVLGQTLTNRIRGNYTVTFSNGSTRNWQEAKTRSLQYASSTSIWKFTANGDTTLASSGTELVSDWGKNSAGDDFVTSIISPIIIQNCSLTSWKFVGGEAKHYIPQGTLTVKFSTNSSGTSVNSCDATGYYLSWFSTSTTSGGSTTSVLVNQYNPY